MIVVTPPGPFEPGGAQAAPQDGWLGEGWPEPDETGGIWSQQDKRHPVLLALAGIATAYAVVPEIWHHGYPHETRKACNHWGCGFGAYSTLKSRASGAIGVIQWQRTELFGPGYEAGNTRDAKIAADLAQGVPLWELDVDLEKMLADLRLLAQRLGLPIADPSPLQHTRTYTAGLLGQLMGVPRRTPQRDIIVPDTESMMVELRRALTRAHTVAQESIGLGRGIPAVWHPYMRTFGPRYSADAVQLHKNVVAHYDEAHRRVHDAQAKGMDNLTPLARYELLCDQQRLALLAEQVAAIAALYHVRVAAQALV